LRSEVTDLESLNRPAKKVFLFVHTGNGLGSSRTRYRRFTTIAQRVGNISYSDSAANGASVVIQEAGLYSVMYTDINTANADRLAVTLNQSNYSLAIIDIPVSAAVCTGASSDANFAMNCYGMAYLRVGDTLEFAVNSAGGSYTNTNAAMFRVEKLL
jgi:hypothetical protein